MERQLHAIGKISASADNWLAYPASTLRENPKTKPPPDFSSGGSLAKRAYFLQQAPALQQAPGQQSDERDVFASAEPSSAIAAMMTKRYLIYPPVELSLYFSPHRERPVGLTQAGARRRNQRPIGALEFQNRI